MNSQELHEAALDGNTAKVKALIDKGADVNAKATENGGVTPLILAAQEGHFEMVRLLLDKGADLMRRCPLAAELL
jgi:ankyrin repeat protein